MNLNFGPEEINSRIIDSFLDDGTMGCLTLNVSDASGNIRASTTLLKSDGSISAVNRCVARALVGGIGLGVDRMFEQAEQEESTGAERSVFEIPIEFQSYLRLHYSDVIKPGMNQTQISGRIVEASGLMCL